MSTTVLVQEPERGHTHACPTWVPVLVGRDPERCKIAIKDPSVSRAHCELYAEMDGRLRVKNLGKHGTWIGEARVEDTAHARAGDVLRLGPTRTLLVVGTLDPLAPQRDPQGVLNVPQRLEPHFVLLRPVGRGGAGIVYEAWDEAKGRRVALKLLLSGGRASAELVERFRREAALQGTMRDYPGIVKVWELGTLPRSGELFFSMEFVRGTTLRHRIKDGLLRAEGVRLMARVARAVHYAHEHGVVHRDLKPSNILVTDRDQVRLTDFGVAKALEDQDGLTVTGVLMGTPNYMAPEQIEDAKRVGPPADVYGLGAILYHVLTGRPPFQGDNLNRMLDQVAQGDYPAPEELDPTIARPLGDLVRAAMVVDPGARTATARALAEGLEAWLRAVAPAKKVSLAPPRPPGA